MIHFSSKYINMYLILYYFKLPEHGETGFMEILKKKGLEFHNVHSAIVLKFMDKVNPCRRNRLSQFLRASVCRTKTKAKQGLHRVTGNA